MNVHLFIVDVDSVKPLCAVHEVIFGDVERQSKDGRDVKDVRQGLIVLIVFCGDFSDLLVEVGDVDVHSEAFFLVGVAVEVIAAISLDLGDEQGHVVSFELIGREYLSSCAIEVVFLGPRRSPLPTCLISVEEGVVVD